LETVVFSLFGQMSVRKQHGLQLSLSPHGYKSIEHKNAAKGLVRFLALGSRCVVLAEENDCGRQAENDLFSSFRVPQTSS